MPWGLQHFQQSRQLHFITFSCYRRRKKLGTPASRRVFESALERVRREYGFYILGYVVMPEHIHMLVSEPERDNPGHRDPVAETGGSAHSGLARPRALLAGALL